MRILLAEDDAMLGDGLRAGLRQAGFQVDWVRDGVAAEREIASGVYAAAVLDLGQPLKDGLEVLKDLRARRNDSPILVLTARDAVPDRVTGLDTGADDYVVKPVDLNELAARLRSLVRRALGAGVGVLGVCFGGQLLAHALGGEVTRSPHPEIGWYEVHSNNPALVPHGPWFQWHFDRFSLPPGAVAVARNLGTTQAFVQGRALGLQFHPEVDSAVVEDWVAGDYKEGGDGGIAELGLDADEIRTRTAAELGDAARRLRLLVRGFLGLLDKDPQHDVGSLG